MYDLLPIDENKGYKKRHWYYENESINKTPVKITNIYDGSEYLKLELVEEQTTFYFTDNYHTESNTYEGQYPATINAKVTATNITNSKVNLIQEDTILDIGKAYTTDVRFHEFIKPNEIPQEIKAEHQVMFKMEDKYYVINITKTYPTKILKIPILNLYLAETSNEPKTYTAIITNPTSTKYKDFYIDFDYNDNIDYTRFYCYGKNSHYKVFKPGDTIKIENIQPSDCNSFFYYVGYIVDDIMFLWDVDIRGDILSESRDDSNDFIDYLRKRSIFATPHVSPMPSPSPTPTPTPSPTLITTQIPAPTPCPTKEVTPKPTQVIEVTNITKESSMPWWVWVVLALTSICTRVIIWMFRHTNRKESE